MSRLSPLNRQYRQKVHVDPRDPKGVAMCDGCGFWVSYETLREQVDFRGGWTPEKTGLFVCATCDDVPQPYYQRQVLPPDPVPLRNPRPDPNVPSDSGWGYLTDSNNDIIVTQTGAGLEPSLNFNAKPIVTATGNSTQGFTTASDLTNTSWR